MLKLGKLPKKEDKRNLKFAKYLTRPLPTIPIKVDYTAGITAWGMMLNDQLGDCTIAGEGHFIEAWTKGKTIIPDSVIKSVYSRNSGYNPQTGQNDNGCVELDVLNDWRKNGVGDDKIGAFTEVNIKKEAEIKAAIYLFNGLYIGVALPKSAEDQFNAGKPWTVVKGSQILGGHCVVLIGYDEQYYYTITWGSIVKIEKSWLKKYMDEAYAIISNDYFIGDKTAEGYDLETLNTDLQLIS
jgi:hypothetical protein